MVKALVLGGAACLDTDLAAIDRADFDVTVGINDALYAFRDIDAMATLHPGKADGWRAKRRAKGWPDVPVYCHDRAWADTPGFRIWRLDEPVMDAAWTRGSSSLYAVGVARYVYRADPVVLAGCPLTPAPNRYRDEDEWDAYGRFRAGWKSLLPELDGVVFSMSGWTRAQLGSPTDVQDIACGNADDRAA